MKKLCALTLILAVVAATPASADRRKHPVRTAGAVTFKRLG
jgi:hypothetical protein